MNKAGLIKELDGKTLVILKSKGNLNILKTELEMTREVNTDVKKLNESQLSIVYYKSILTGWDLSNIENAVFIDFQMDEFISPELRQVIARFNRINSPITNTIVISHLGA